jgi:hypothetical protein
MDIPRLLITWRGRPASAVVIVAGIAAITAVVATAGGSPTPLTHLYYVVVLLCAVLWGTRWAAVIGAVCGFLAGPGTALLIAAEGPFAGQWWIRAIGLMLVGAVCGALTGSLLHRLEQLERLNAETIAAFVRAIDARDPYTARHSEKVSAYGLQLARTMGLEPEACERVRLAGLLHDVGKVGLERSVLHKAGPLSDDEWQQVREHPCLSAHIIGGVERFAAFLPGARHHHERFDGTGYPDRLAGTAIPLDARILAVADAFDAMTSDRSYRPALDVEQARHRLAQGSGTQFDPECVRAFLASDPDPAQLEMDLGPLLDLPTLDDDAAPRTPPQPTRTAQPPV